MTEGALLDFWERFWLFGNVRWEGGIRLVLVDIRELNAYSLTQHGS